MPVLTIALNTFREAVRDKILYVLVVMAALLILISRALGWVSYGGDKKIMTDMGLLAIWLFGAFVAVFIGTGMIYKEIDKRTLYTILSKPIERWQFVLGKYCGLLLTTYICLLLLSAVMLGYMALLDAPITGAIVQQIALTFVEMMVVTAIAIFFSSASSPLLSAVFTSMVFVIGQQTQWIYDLGTQVQAHAPWVRHATYTLFLLVPNLHDFNARQEAVNAAGAGGGWAIAPELMFYRVVYGMAYAAALLLAAVFFFRRRSF